MFDILTFYHTDLAGNCSRPAEGYDSYRHGAGSSARMMSPEHGYQLRDGSYVLFVDDSSCARGMMLTTLRPAVSFIGMLIDRIITEIYLIVCRDDLKHSIHIMFYCTILWRISQLLSVEFFRTRLLVIAEIWSIQNIGDIQL